MAKKLLWLRIGSNSGAYVDAGDVYEGIDLYSYGLRVWGGIPGGSYSDYSIPEVIFWNEEEYETIRILMNEDIDAAGDILDALVGDKGEDCIDEYIVRKDCLCFSYDENSFFNLSELNWIKCYDYVKDTEHVTLTCDSEFGDYYAELEIKEISEYVLDIWDGNNSYYPKSSTGLHAILKKVLADGQPALLLHSWSQWSGDELDEAVILEKEEVLNMLENHPEYDEILAWLNWIGSM